MLKNTPDTALSLETGKAAQHRRETLVSQRHPTVRPQRHRLESHVYQHLEHEWQQSRHRRHRRLREYSDVADAKLLAKDVELQLKMLPKKLCTLRSLGAITEEIDALMNNLEAARNTAEETRVRKDTVIPSNDTNVVTPNDINVVPLKTVTATTTFVVMQPKMVMYRDRWTVAFATSGSGENYLGFSWGSGIGLLYAKAACTENDSTRRAAINMGFRCESYVATQDIDTVPPFLTIKKGQCVTICERLGTGYNRWGNGFNLSTFHTGSVIMGETLPFAPVIGWINSTEFDDSLI